MKRFIFLLLAFIAGLPAFCIYNLPIIWNWQRLECSYVKETIRGRGRSAIYLPELYQSEDYLSVQSEYVNYENVRITITDEQGFIVKNDVIQVVAGGENLYYIGDLEDGSYEITVDFKDFILSANLDVFN